MNRADTSRQVAVWIGWLAIVLGILCILEWIMNLIGWISWGSATGQAIMGPVGIALGIGLLYQKKGAGRPRQ